jgi:sensor histidine kinase YesM
VKRHVTGQLGRCPSLSSAPSNQATGTRRPVSLDMSDQELVTVYAEDEFASGSYQALQKELQRQERRIEAQQQELDELRAQVRALIGGRAAVRE